MAVARKFDHQHVLNLTREAIVKEELAIPVYDSHISASLFWSGLSEEVRRKILEGLQTLTHDSAGHVLLLQRVEAIIVATKAADADPAKPHRNVVTEHKRRLAS